MSKGSWAATKLVYYEGAYESVSFNENIWLFGENIYSVNAKLPGGHGVSSPSYNSKSL